MSASLLVHLHKKIAIPNTGELTSVGWNNEDGWIACGGVNGLVKLMKLESSEESNLSTKVSLQQKLHGHKTDAQESKILQIIWNTKHNKLTTTDANGLIIVWTFNKSTQKWTEEMINDRKKSQTFVVDMRWNAFGDKILIAYNDGCIIVGNVNGQREFSIQLDTKPNETITNVEWSPSSNQFVLCFSNSIYPVLYDSKGNKLRKIQILCQNTEDSDPSAPLQDKPRLVDIQWHASNHQSRDFSHPTDDAHGKHSKPHPPTAPAPNNASAHQVPCLAIAFSNGRLQIMKDFKDDTPVLLDTDMNIHKICWNPSGTILAVVGKKRLHEGMAEANVNVYHHFVQFFDYSGNNLNTLQIPCRAEESIKITDCDWEHNGIRIAITVENYIYFAIVKTKHNLYSLFNKNILCYCTHNSTNVEDDSHAHDTHDTNSNVFFIKVKDDSIDVMTSGPDADQTQSAATQYMYNAGRGSKLLAIVGNVESDFVMIVSTHLQQAENSENATDGNCVDIALCNSIGRCIVRKEITFHPLFFCMTNEFIILANHDVIYTYQHSKNKKLLQLSMLRLSSKNSNTDLVNIEKTIHIDQLCDPLYLSKASMRAHVHASDELTTKYDLSDKSENAMTAIAGYKQYCLIARTNGDIISYSMLKENILFKFNLTMDVVNVSAECKLKHANIISSHINCDFTKLAFVDLYGNLMVVDVKDSNDRASEKSEKTFEFSACRRDVWEMMFCSDNKNMYATMERGKLFIFYKNEPETPNDSTLNLLKFNNLQITSLALENILSNASSKPLDHDRDDNEYLTRVVEKAILVYKCAALKQVLTMLSESDDKLLSVKEKEQRFTAVFDHINKTNKDGIILWKLLAKKSLLNFKFSVAESAFVKCKDYKSIQFIKRLKKIGSGDNNKKNQMNFKQKAEIFAFFGKIKESEQIYLENNAINLALDLNVRMGNWERVNEIIEGKSQSNINISDESLSKAYKNIGDYFFDLHFYNNALKYYLKCQNYFKMCQCAYKLENFTLLTNIVNNNIINVDNKNNNSRIKQLANMFKSVGMCEEACKVLNSVGSIRESIELAVELNEWKLATKIYNENKSIFFSQNDGSESNFNMQKTVKDRVDQLIEHKNYLDAINIYFQTQFFLECAKLIQVFISSLQNAASPTSKGNNCDPSTNPLFFKKLYVLSAIAIDSHRKKLIIGDTGSKSNGQRNSDKIEMLLKEDSLLSSNTGPSGKNASSSLSFQSGQAWRSAECYHLWILLNRKISQFKLLGLTRIDSDSEQQKQHDILKQNLTREILFLCQFLCNKYSKIINEIDIYNIYALISFQTKNFKQCSNALTKLEYLTKKEEEQQDDYQGYRDSTIVDATKYSRSKRYRNLAIKIFSRNAPTDSDKSLNKLIEMISDTDFDTDEEIHISVSCHDLCMLSGKYIDSNAEYKICKTCRHKTLTHELNSLKVTNCPLCHANILN